MNFEIVASIAERGKEFKDRPSQFYFNYHIKPIDINDMVWKNKHMPICCHELLSKIGDIAIKSDGGCTLNQKIIGLELYTNNDSINLNFCPNCSERVTFTLSDQV
jgi:hypothetical protein